jgi:hypothetical protein
VGAAVSSSMLHCECLSSPVWLANCMPAPFVLLALATAKPASGRYHARVWHMVTEGGRHGDCHYRTTLRLLLLSSSCRLCNARHQSTAYL